MLRCRLLSALHAVPLGVIVLVGSAHAQSTDSPGSLYEMPLPGGLRGALAAIDDPVPADRSQFLLEFIRRTYHAPLGKNGDRREADLQTLLAYLDQSSARASTGPSETLPLPLPAAIWTDVVFGGSVTVDNLASAILRSRDAALLYYGLLSLDDATRAWLVTEPALLKDLASRYASTFVVAAPGLRVADRGVRVPGGEAAEPVWRALVGQPLNEPAAFVRALLAHRDGQLAYFFGTMAQLPPVRVRFALNLDSPDQAARVASTRALYAVFERIVARWSIRERTFWRPALDPALLVMDLPVDATGRSRLPGTRQFWDTVFKEADRRQPDERASRALAEGQPADFAWLCEQVFKGPQTEQRRRYQIVLFGSRLVTEIRAETARDAVEAVRAAGTLPALIASLERAKLADVGAFANAARRAARLSAIGNDARAFRALAQFQGMIALITRAALRGSLPADSLAGLVSSLSAVDVNERGDYEGRLVRWFEAHPLETSKPAASAASASVDPPAELYQNGDGPMDLEALRLLAGPTAAEPRFVDWEGTRYRLDLASAETTRLKRHVGEHHRPYLSSALTLVAVADALDQAELTPDALLRELEALAHVGNAVEGGDSEAWEDTGVATRYREAAAALRGAARDANIRKAARLAPALRMLADDLFARGLLDLVYATALGQPERTPILASEAASRHDFNLRRAGPRRGGPWELPVAGAETRRSWHVAGSLLGLDVTLAEFSLIRLSSNLPIKPTFGGEDRRALVSVVALVQPASLTEQDSRTLVTAIRKGRTKLASLRTATEAAALADEIGLSPARRSLLPWVVAHDPQRVGFFLSPGELLWLGLGTAASDARLDAWGAPGQPRLGCLCLRLDRRAWETLTGRWHSGILASGFPDLNLRLAELLAELQMPAALLGPVLASATLDFINTATTRDPDDRRGLLEFVQALRAERVADYLALLTTDGPLVPVGAAPDPAAQPTRPR